MARVLSNYINGDYIVILLSDGTKIRYWYSSDREKQTKETLRKNDPTFSNIKVMHPENIDIKLTDYCNCGCSFCHEKSTPNGKQMSKLTLKRLKHLLSCSWNRYYGEVALGGGALSQDPLFPELIDFIGDLHRKNYFEQSTYGPIFSLTINSKELSILYEKEASGNSIHLNKLYDAILGNIIHGVGVSYSPDETDKKSLLKIKRDFPNNVVVHTIFGITRKEDYEWLIENHFKILVLGYKDFGRGSSYLKLNKEEIQKNKNDLQELFKTRHDDFELVSFDNLALEQLRENNFNFRDIISDEDFEKYYMGDEGVFTMFIDLVENEFAVSSMTPKEKRHPLPKIDFKDDAIDYISCIFQTVRQEALSTKIKK